MTGDDASGPIDGVRYGHTNLIARDWRRLSDWYVRLFGCTPVPPERDYSGPDLERGTAVPNAALQGVHLRLPGHGDDGPTLEIYTFSSTDGAPEVGIDRPGFRHIAFAVADVHAARRRVLDEGGSSVGEVVTLTTADGRRVTWCYVTDPEGNAVELQSWAPPA
jgi:predicted enzyme related to lactoylglutathione lyase